MAKPHHQPRRQGRHAGAIRVDLAEAALQEPPVDRLCQLHQFVAHVDDLVEPRAKKILLARFPSLAWLHE
jgi:hypothetical protein